jgi:CubicO group peptidase (beta-lactamase class C family)
LVIAGSTGGGLLVGLAVLGLALLLIGVGAAIVHRAGGRSSPTARSALLWQLLGWSCSWWSPPPLRRLHRRRPGSLGPDACRSVSVKKIVLGPRP